jgi:plastocyanin
MKGRLFSFVSTVVLTTAYALKAFSGDAEAKQNGSIQGTIFVTGKDQLFEEILSARSLNRYEEHVHLSGQPRPYTLSEKAVVYIENFDGGQKFSPPARSPQLNQQDLMFRPLVLPILAGTAVDFPNNDEVFHNVFSYSKPKEFDLGRYPRGQHKRVVFDEPGVVNVYCDIHAYMYATILVLDNPFYAVPDEAGHYEISNVPPGTYRLGFWYGRKKVDSRTVTVRAGEPSSVDFTY